MTALALVVPVYNEEIRVPEFAQLLVDFVGRACRPAASSSSSTTGAPTRPCVSSKTVIARNAGRRVRLVRRSHAGKGARGRCRTRDASAAYAGFCDLDLSTPLDDLDRVYRAATRAEVLATGSRDLATSTLVRRETRTREFLGRAYNRLLQATVVPGIVDTQCGAKVASRSVWEQILPWCREPGYAWDAEAIAIALAAGIPVQEVPISWRHDDRSKVRVAPGRHRHGARDPTYPAGRDARAARSGAAAAEVFDDVNAELLMESDRSHWWFRSKAAFVATALRRTAGQRESGMLVDVGAGSGGVTSMLGWDPARVVVVEGNKQLVGQAHRAYGLTGVRATVECLPLAPGDVDVVCFLDVLEHLAEPRVALQEAWRVLAPGGRLVVNVPAHPWLWSSADEFLGHVRRYTRRGLRTEIEAAGFRTRLVTHVFSWLVPPVWATRRLRARHGPGARARPHVAADRRARRPRSPCWNGHSWVAGPSRWGRRSCASPRSRTRPRRARDERHRRAWRARRRAAPAQNAAEIPKKSAITTPNTDAHTDAAPLTAQRNAVGVSGVPAATRMPIENGMPSMKPSGARMRDGGGDAHGSGCAIGCLEDARRDESDGS